MSSPSSNKHSSASTEELSSGKSSATASSGSQPSNSSENTTELIGKDLHERNFINAYEMTPTESEDISHTGDTSFESSISSSTSTSTSEDNTPPTKRVKLDDTKTTASEKPTPPSK